MTKKETVAALADNQGCLGKAADDEPVFILRAQDKLSSKVVRIWAGELKLATDPGNVASRQKADAALALADNMDRWRTKHGGGKVPD